VGHDVGMSAPWLLASAVAAVLAGFALRETVRASDVLATLVTVQIFGLLVSPISWSHHWVWVVPAMLWMVHGPARSTRIVMVMWLVWGVAVGSFVISYLLRAQPTIWVIERPWYLSALGWVYPACGLLTLVVIPVALRLRARTPEPVAV
jgi:alpha-1,2-mannosyltransferase